MSPFKANLLLLLAGMLWGMGFVAQETAMDDIGPSLFVGIRFCIAALAVLPFAWREYNHLPSNKAVTFTLPNKLFLVAIGAVFFFGMLLQQIGLVYTTVTKAGFLTGLYVLLVPLFLLMLLREHQHWMIWPCSLIALAGIFLINNTEVDKLNFGDYLIIICSLFWAAHVITVGKLSQRINAPMIIACVQFSVCGLLGLLSYWLTAGSLSIEPLIELSNLIAVIPEVLYTALVAGAFAFSLQIIAQRYTSASSAAILLSSEALFAALFAVLFIGESLSFNGYLGCLLLFAAMLTIQLMPSKKSSEHQLS